MLNLIVEPAQEQVGEPTSRDVPGRDDLTADEAQPCLWVDERHAFVVRGEAAAEVDREDRLLDCDEGHRLQRGQDPEDARQVQRDVQRQEGALHDGGTVACPDEPLHAQDVDARAAQDHEGEEQGGTPTIHGTGQATPGDTRSVDRRRARRTVADVGVTTHLVGVGVVRAVLRHPPAEAHSDQEIADGETQEPVGPAGAEHLLVAGVVAHEAELGEHEPEERGDGECDPGIAEQDQPGEPGAERAHRQRDLGAVVAETTVEQAGFSNLAGEDAEVLGRGFDGVRLHVSHSSEIPSWSATADRGNTESRRSHSVPRL